MKSKYTNKNGVKLLAAIMAFAVVLVAGFVVIGDDRTDATAISDASVKKLPSLSEEISSIESTGDSYYVYDDSTVTFGSGASGNVSFFVKTGKTLTITNVTGVTSKIYAVASVPIEDVGTIEAADIAEVVVTISDAVQHKFEAFAVSAETDGNNASGTIEVLTGVVANGAVAGWAMKVVKTGSQTWYSKGAITDIKAGATGGPTSAVLKANVDGINVAIGSGDGTTNTNEFRLTGATLNEDLTVTFGTENKVKVGVAMGTNGTLIEGMLSITKGTVEVYQHLNLTPGTFAGVAPENLGTALTGGNLTAGLTLNETSKKLTANAFVFNTKITSESGIKLAPSMAISFMQGSAFDGQVIGTTTSSDVGTIDMKVGGKTAGRDVTITNDGSEGSLAVSAKNTKLSVESYITGSELAVSAMNSVVTFVETGVTGAAVIFADGLVIEGRTLEMGVVDVIIPKDSTVTIKKNTDNAKLTFTTGSLYVFGKIQGDVASDGNISWTGEPHGGLFSTKANQSEVKKFTGDVTPEISPIEGDLTAINALYMLSEAQKIGWDIDGTVIDWSSAEEYYVTDNGKALTGDSPGKPVRIALDGVEILIKGKAEGVTTINVVEGTDFTVSNTTLLSENKGNLVLKLEDGSTFNIRNSDVMMEVDKKNKADVKVSTSVRNYEGASGPIPVGYMRELIVKGDISGCNITVYGKLTIDDKAKLNRGSTVDIMGIGTFEIDGQLDVLGTVNFNAGSTGLINGTMNIGTSDGGAEVNINKANVTVSKDGEVKVAAPKNNTNLKNTLTVAGSDEPEYEADGKLKQNCVPRVFTVEGKLDVRGTITADQIYDKGTIQINGKTGTDGVTITVFDGVTLEIQSVDGKVTVTDTNIMGESKRTYATVSDGNEVVLENVTGVVITESVTSTTYVGADEKNYKFYLCNMDVSGALGAAKGATSATITINKTAYFEGAKKYTSSNGKIEISQNLVLGKNVDLVSSAKGLVISGTVTCVAEGASMTFNNGSATKVSGSIVVKEGASLSDGLAGEEYLNAVEHVVSDNTGTTTYTYTTFEAALAMIADADDKTITVHGSVSTKGDSEVPAGMTVNVSGTLKVSKGSTVIAKAGSVVEGDKIDVKGTFTSEDYQNDLDIDVTADVVSVNGDAKTWTSLPNALAIAAPGSVINVDRDIKLDASSMIPEGVTVKTEKDITIDNNVVLTVAGTLTLTKGELTAAPATGAASDALGKVAVTGTGVIGVVASGAGEPAIFDNVSGVHFGKIVDSKSYFFLSNVNYAVSAIDEKLEGEMKIYGKVDLGNVTFAKTEKMAEDLVIVIKATSSGSDKTVVTGDMKLVGATLEVEDNVRYTGSVTATAAGADATVAFDKASNVVVSTYTDNAASTPVDYMLISGNTAAGKATVTAGTVTVGVLGASGVATGGLTTNDGFTFVVGEGATLQVPASSAITVKNNEKGDKATFVVYGGLVLKGKLSIEGTAAAGGQPQKNSIVDVFGNVVISESNEATSGLIVGSHGILNVFGTVTISDEVGKEGKLTNNNVITVGSKPTALGAAGTITGEIAFGSGYVLVYDGEVTYDPTEVESTVVVINGVEYVKIIGDGNVREILDAADIKLAGFEGFVAEDGETEGAVPTKIYSDEAMTQEIAGDSFTVGEFDAIYFELNASVVKGLVSVGTGIQVFIDGANVGYGGQGYPLTVGTHTVDFNIETGYDGKNVVITFNGQTVQKGGQITITADMKDFSLIVTGATPAETIVVTPSEPSESDDGTGLTDYLLIVLVVLAAILVVIVAIRMLRN